MSLIPWFKIVNAETGAFVGGSSGFDRTWAWCEDIESAGRRVAPVEFDDSTVAEIREVHNPIRTYRPKHRRNVPAV